MRAGDQLPMEWDIVMSFLSFVAAVFGSWCSLVVIEQAIFARWMKRPWSLWVHLAGIALGACGIWTTQFVGMAALDLGIEFSFRIDYIVVSSSIPSFAESHRSVW